MRRDSRLSRMLHVLIHMDRHHRRVTSEAIARMLDTNPVVVRRSMAGLRERGYVTSEKGHGGGWELARGLDAISLADVHAAIGAPPLLAIAPSDDQPDCLVEKAVAARLGTALAAAEAALREQFASISVADIAADFDRRLDELGLTGPADCAPRQAG